MQRQWRSPAPIAGGLVIIAGLIGAPRALAQSAPQGPGTGISVTAEGQVSANWTWPTSIWAYRRKGRPPRRRCRPTARPSP